MIATPYDLWHRQLLMIEIAVIRKTWNVILPSPLVIDSETSKLIQSDYKLTIKLSLWTEINTNKYLSLGQFSFVYN